MAKIEKSVLSCSSWDATCTGHILLSYRSNLDEFLYPRTGKSIHFERHMTAPEVRLVLAFGFDPRGYFLGDENLFKLAIWLYLAYYLLML